MKQGVDPAKARESYEQALAVAREAGLEDYRVVVNVGHSAGQTVFHLHWHILGHRTPSHFETHDDLTSVTEL